MGFESYLADSLGVGTFSEGMEVDFLGHTAEVRGLFTDEAEEALIYSLNVAFVGEMLGG